MQGNKPDKVTVYTVRVETGTGRRAGMDDLNGGIQLCLMGKHSALLHRVGQIKEGDNSEAVMSEICEVCTLSSGHSYGVASSQRYL
jgi:hypothetical protein